MVKHDLIETWTDADLAAEPQQTFMTWADAVQVIGAIVHEQIDQAEREGDKMKEYSLRDAWEILLTGVGK